MSIRLSQGERPKRTEVRHDNHSQKKEISEISESSDTPKSRIVDFIDAENEAVGSKRLAILERTEIKKKGDIVNYNEIAFKLNLFPFLCAIPAYQ